MKSENLLESIINYSDHDGIDENELVSPLEKYSDMEELFEQIYSECNVNPLFDRAMALREMTNTQIAAYAPVKIDGNIDTNYIKNESELESLKQFISKRRNNYKGYALIDARIDKIVKQFEI